MKRIPKQRGGEKQSQDDSRRLPFTRGDPLTALVTNRLHAGVGTATFVVLLVLNIPIFLVTTLDHLWLSNAFRLGLLFDYGWWGFHITLVPAIVYFFLWMPKGIYRTIEDLREKETIIIPKETSPGQNAFKKFVDDFDAWYSHPVWAIAAVAINLLGSYFISVPVHALYKTWETANGFLFWYVVMFYWVVIYSIITLALIRYIIVIVWLNRMFKRFQINVRVLYPDGAGGLSPLGNFSVKTGYLIGIVGIASLLAMVSESYARDMQFSGLAFNPTIIIWQVCFICLSPVAFFAPIGAAHASMKKAKEAFITQISKQFETHLTGIKLLLDSDSSVLDERIRKIKQLQELHAIASRFPVWPFNVANLVRFFSAVLSPIALALFSKGTDLLLNR